MILNSSLVHSTVKIPVYIELNKTQQCSRNNLYSPPDRNNIVTTSKGRNAQKETAPSLSPKARTVHQVSRNSRGRGRSSRGVDNEDNVHSLHIDSGPRIRNDF
jgi:hypothetical protein